MGLIGKMKEKLHIGDSDAGVNNYSGETKSGPTTTKPGVNPTSGTTGQFKEVGTGSASHTPGSHAQGQTGQHYSGIGHSSTGSGQSAGSKAAQGASNVAHGTSTGGATAGGAHGGSTSGTHSSAGGATGATNVHVPGGSSTTTGQSVAQSVTIHEHDPNWQKARDLTQAAEYQSKVSAAKAYEAEAFLVGAQESHDVAQQALTQKTHLAAQAEAEKRNIGQADYVHREYDHAKKVQEDHEKHRIEINKNLETTKNLVTEKERELQAVLPQARQQQAHIESLTGKLGSLQDAKAGLENKEAANAAKLRELEAKKGQFAGDIESLEASVVNLNKRAEDLERQAAAARQEATTAAARLKELKGNVAAIARDQDVANKSLHNVSRDLEAYRAKEAELAAKLKEAQLASQKAADAAAAKEADLQLARQQFEAEKAKGQPVEQEIEKYRKQVQEKERALTEAMTSSKAAKAAYEKFLAQANEADAAYKQALTEKERKISTYSEHKQEAEIANARATEMWNQAKKFGNTGDANALQRLAEAEKMLATEEGGVSKQLVAPNVGPKQPTTEGPKFSRTEDAKERNEDTQKESVRTKTAA